MDGSAEQPPEPESERTFTDAKGRHVAIERYADGAEPLVEMYSHFDSRSRSQGLPPQTEEQIRDWLIHVLENGIHVVARHEDTLVGHAMLLPYEDTSELAIFVRPTYQTAGIGTELIDELLAYGRDEGVDHVWLTVSRDNRIAIRLYKSAGFETRLDDRGEVEMERDL